MCSELPDPRLGEESPNSRQAQAAAKSWLLRRPHASQHRTHRRRRNDTRPPPALRQASRLVFDGLAPLYRPFNANKRGRAQQWNLTIERQLPWKTVVSGAYVGAHGTHLLSALQPLNVLNPNDPRVIANGANLPNPWDPFQRGSRALPGMGLTSVLCHGGASAAALPAVLQHSGWAQREMSATLSTILSRGVWSAASTRASTCSCRRRQLQDH